MALAAIGGRPGMNNIEVSEIIAVSDQGQISRMMKRLQMHGLIENSQRHTNRQVKAWRLTINGEAVIHAHRGGRALLKAHRTANKNLKLAISRSAASDPAGNRSTAAPGTTSTQFRMTPLTHDVLTAIANLSEGGSRPNNREIALAADGRDESQISTLLRRLQEHGLLQNTGPVTPSARKAWRLTPRAQHLLSSSSSTTPRTNQ